jgi:predicted RNA polymerase sigma factor
MAESLELEHLLRAEAPQVLGALVRRFGHFDIAEDSVQDALLAAAQQWPAQGVPDHPRGWLIRVGYRRMIDQLRAVQARQRREYELAGQSTPASLDEPATDDSVTLLFLCCHPLLSPVSQVALTLRAVGGLTTAEIAHAYGVTEVAKASGSAEPSSRSRRPADGSSCRRPRTELIDSPPYCRCCI